MQVAIKMNFILHFGMRPLKRTCRANCCNQVKSNTKTIRPNKMKTKIVIIMEVQKMKNELIRRNYDFEIRAEKDEKKRKHNCR